MKRQSEDPKIFNSALITTLGSVMDDLSPTSFPKDFEDRCSGSPWKGILVCVVMHEDRVKDVPWLHQLGFGFYWDLPPVVIRNEKRGEVKLFDDGQNHPRKVHGDKVMTILHEVRNIHCHFTPPT